MTGRVADRGAGDRGRCAIDVRIYLAVMVTAMALAFAAGVSSIGSNTQAEIAAAAVLLSNTAGGAASSPAGTLPSSNPVSQKEAVEAGSSSVELGSGSDAEEIIQPRRERPIHNIELGPKMERDVKESHVNIVQPSYEDYGNGAVRGPSDTAAQLGVPADGGGEEEEEVHLPQGQHLLVDIKNVNADFLDSEERLSGAMVDVVRKAGLTLLSYHCHSLKPRGVSCAGILLESHISFHTWPDEGVITLDLFTCGDNPLLPMVPVVESMFGVPRDSEDQEGVKTVWSHELRGFRSPNQRKNNYLDDQSDLSYWVVSPLGMEVKNLIISTESKFQRVDIWDILATEDTPSYEDAIAAGLKPGDPRWFTNEVVKPERLLFLDGTLQSMSDSEREYHEALVHPAMFAHPSPRRVAIVGGGEGATLREVLKHNTVEEAIMIELDAELVEIARKHLPYMNNCSDLVGSAENCFKDPRSNIVYEDGIKWFMDRFGDKASSTERKFDVIILDALDPEDEVDVADKLYSDNAFLTALFNALTPDGLLLSQVGTAPDIHDPRADLGVYSRREYMFNLLENHSETANMFVYEEAHCGFNEPHSFLLVCKSPECRRRWYAETDAVDYWIYERVLRTKSGEPALVHYDGATQRSFQVPPRAWETVYCRREPEPFECAYRGLDLSVPIFDFKFEEEEGETSFELRTVEGEDGSEHTAVFALEDIPEGSYVMPDDLSRSLELRDESLSNLQANVELVSGDDRTVIIKDFLDYVEQNGHTSMANGSGITYVEVGGTALMRKTENEAEANVGRWMPLRPEGKLPPYSPVYERHMQSFDLFLVATKNIKKGEEVVKHENLRQ